MIIFISGIYNCFSNAFVTAFMDFIIYLCFNVPIFFLPLSRYTLNFAEKLFHFFID